MSNLTIQQFCQLETLKTDLHLESSYECQEQFQESFTLLEVTDLEGNLLQELIVVI
ncbi:MAG: hypothetical protein HC930_04500 [Hydrococcus sp. SU_1_0]|nr:hypothetical protein [Hydrococcus sp. SU_1_0]